ncbi:MAG: hypothetical protein OXQ31_09560 [Spirochaetaceae bacterium]|nr:hypothetical protein [Spirochaetaceae bacterium]
MSEEEQRALKGQMLLELREAEAELACAEKRVQNFANQLRGAAAVLSGASMGHDQVAAASDGTLMRRDSGAVAKWPTYEEAVGAVKELNELRKRASSLQAQVTRAFA